MSRSLVATALMFALMPIAAMQQRASPVLLRPKPTPEGQQSRWNHKPRKSAAQHQREAAKRRIARARASKRRAR